jgi:isochorismate synthase
MNFEQLLNKITLHYKAKLPFAIFSLSDSETIVAYFQKKTHLYETEDFSDEGFVFAPFNYNNKAFCILKKESEVFKIKIKKAKFLNQNCLIDENISEKKKYINVLNKAIHTIQNTEAKKIVVSRCKKITLKKFDIEALVSNIFLLYPSAFRYIWCHPKTDFWCGASPELLVETEGKTFATMALAGTQKYNENIPLIWNDKEINEQQLVVDDITTRLQKVSLVLKISKRYNHKAANLVHLRSDITGILKNGKASLSTIASILHPTPAICGSPRNLARNFILKNEGYNRAFYTGFMGPITEEKKYSYLFVNLRCLKISNNEAQLFVGGGITKDSIPEKEWEETQNKLKTMLQVIQTMV